MFGFYVVTRVDEVDVRFEASKPRLDLNPFNTNYLFTSWSSLMKILHLGMDHKGCMIGGKRDKIHLEYTTMLSNIEMKSRINKEKTLTEKQKLK